MMRRRMGSVVYMPPPTRVEGLLGWERAPPGYLTRRGVRIKRLPRARNDHQPRVLRILLEIVCIQDQLGIHVEQRLVACDAVLLSDSREGITLLDGVDGHAMHERHTNVVQVLPLVGL